MTKRALILGILGQDGSYMAELLRRKGYEVHGIIKEVVKEGRLEWLRKLIPDIQIHPIVLHKSALFLTINNIRPTEIYNFAGVSNVFSAWNNMDNTFNINAKIPQDILESIITIDKSIKYFQASSCLIFGNDTSGKQNELTPRCPIYPYGAAKLYADNMIKECRRVFGAFAVSGIFFPHESERRSADFFTKKVTSIVAKIKQGSGFASLSKNTGKLKLGNLSHLRDWGYAPDYMEAAHLMMQAKEPEDYVIGTGLLTKTEDFVKMAFEYADLDYKRIIEYDEKMDRTDDTNILCADISKIKTNLGWLPKTTVNEMIKKMINSEQN